MVRPVFFIVLVFSVLSKAVISENSQNIKTETTDTAEETQHAVCRIITQEVETFANATIKRQLKGVCTTSQIERKFRQLERKLRTELNIIKTLLTHSNKVSIKTVDDYDYYNFDTNIAEKSLSQDDSIITVSETLTRHSSWLRTEIVKLNDTIFLSKGSKLYTYYWAISEIRLILQTSGSHIRSPYFYVLGHELFLQLFSNHLESTYLGIQLHSTNNFSKKHKFTILEPFDSRKDINSQTLGGTSSYETLYRVPYAKLQERNYLYNDTIMIKVTIFVDS